MRICSWWAIVAARITVRAASYRRLPAQAIIARAPFPERAVRARPWPGRCPVRRVRRESPRAAGVRSGPWAVRCGYGSSLTSPRVIDWASPGCFRRFGTLRFEFVREMPGLSMAGLQSIGSSLVGLAVRWAGGR